MTAISYHDTFNDLQDLDWSEGGPFARRAWFALLENSGMTPLIAAAHTDGQAVALPLRKSDKCWEALTNWYAFTWSDLRGGDTVSSDLLEQLARDMAKRTDRVLLTKLPDEDGTMQRLKLAFRKAGWLVCAERCDTNHVLPVAGRSYEQYLADRPGPLRTTLKRKAKKVEVRLSDSFDAADWAAYEKIYAESWKPEEGNPALLRNFAKAESDAGRFRFAVAVHDRQPVAAQFWTVDGKTAYIHKLAHRNSAQHLSPGTTLTAALFERVIDTDGVELVDFGTGDDPYKRDWMEQVRTRWQLTCLRAGSPRNWPVIARHGARKLVSALSHG